MTTLTLRRQPSTVAAAVALVVVLVAAAGAAAWDHDECETAQQAFSECVPYVVGMEPAATPSCCTGLGDLRDMAHTAAQRRTICGCLLAEVNAAGKVEPARAAALPTACKVQIGFVPTTHNFNCATIP
ncbi:hypothetical protein ACP70R_041814 [Stipagrostis hirtigluma subsp. patula]